MPASIGLACGPLGRAGLAMPEPPVLFRPIEVSRNGSPYLTVVEETDVPPVGAMGDDRCLEVFVPAGIASMRRIPECGLQEVLGWVWKPTSMRRPSLFKCKMVGIQGGSWRGTQARLHLRLCPRRTTIRMERAEPRLPFEVATDCGTSLAEPGEPSTRRSGMRGG